MKTQKPLEEIKKKSILTIGEAMRILGVGTYVTFHKKWIDTGIVIDISSQTGYKSPRFSTQQVVEAPYKLAQKIQKEAMSQ